MAKIIACPTCGENVEIPPGSAGQVIKCAACGTPIKLVSKKKSDPRDAYGSSAGSFAGASGSSYTVPESNEWGNDDPPSLGECAQCGTVLADPTQLVEDRGRLICPNCAGRSKVAKREDVQSFRPRSAEAASAAPIAFTGPATVIARHGPFMSLNFATLAGGICGAIAIGASIFLMFHPKPIGTLDSMVKPIASLTLPPPVGAVSEFPDEERKQILADVARAGEIANRQDPESLKQAMEIFQKVNASAGARKTTNNELNQALTIAASRATTIEAQLTQMKAPPTEVATATPPAEPQTLAPVVEPPSPGPTTSADPATTPVATTQGGIFWESAEQVTETPRLLKLGLQNLDAGRYKPADDCFAKALQQLPPALSGKLLAEHVLAFSGRAASLIGLEDYRDADAAINRVYRSATPTAELIYNRGIVNLKLDKDHFSSLDEAVGLLKQQPSDQAYDLVTAMLDQWKFNPTVRQKAEELQKSALATMEAAHPGEKRLSGHWVTEAKFDEYRGYTSSIELLEKDIVTAEMQVKMAQARMDRVTAEHADTATEERAVASWKEKLEQNRASVESIRSKLPEGFDSTDLKPMTPAVPAGLILPEE